MLVPTCIISTNRDMGLQYVVDGGGLLHKLSWPKHPSYADICQMYILNVRSSYDHALVVFDGYHGSSTKDEAHRRRTGNEVGASVAVSREMHLTMSKEAFLANSSNKQDFINLLAEDMVKADITVEHAIGDAD